MLILHNGSTVRGQSTLLKIRKHEKQMDRRKKFHNGVTEKFQSFIVRDAAVRFIFSAKPGHNIDERIYAAFSRIQIMNLPVAILRLPNATVC